MTLTIDSYPCDTGPDTPFETAYDAETMLLPAAAGRGLVVKLLLPRTANNDRLFGATHRFNAEPHSARLMHDGAVLLAGRIILRAEADDAYHVEIRSNAAQWALQAAQARLDEVPLGFSGHLTPSDIAAGWSDSRPVKFFPVLRDSYEQRNNPSDLQPLLQLLTPDDYHPFVQVDALLRNIFAEAGYTIESRFMESDLFRSLYISGAYPSRDTAAAEKRMGFQAVRLTEATAEADAMGRVYATPYGAGNILGNIVQTATPLATDQHGIVRTDPYNNGNCFGLDERKIVYRPLSQIGVSFEYRLRYTTSHRILTRDRLRGFDTLNLGVGGNISFPLPNRYADRKGSLRVRTTYRVMVFGSASNAQYRLFYSANGVLTPLAEFTGRTTLATTAATGTVAAPVLYVHRGDRWDNYTGDWALYDGHIGETGETTVEFTLRTPVVTAGPSSPCYFNTIYFAGADEGMRLTLHTECSLRPLFSPAPAYGTHITEADVLHHGISRLKLIEAVQHLFNLRFYTDETLRRVWIEPADELFDESRTADWSHRTDFSEPIVWEDAAIGRRESRTYAYRTGDGATTRLGLEEGAPFGSWHIQTGSYATEPGVEQYTNPLFSPTLSAPGGCSSAPSALLLQVGDRDDMAGDGINFTPRIVRYRGLQALPADERWGDPSSGEAYPLAAFHLPASGDEAPSEGHTLCFGDRDGATGLHRFYDREELIATEGRHVTLTLRLDPHELESLFTPGTGAPDLRWTFRITTDAGHVRATLRRIGRYNPAQRTARCTFTLLTHNRP